MNHIAESFRLLFADGDVEGAANLLEQNDDVLQAHRDYAAHPLLRSCVERNGGHCYKQSQLKIADLLIPKAVREFRDAVLADDSSAVERLLDVNPELIGAEFTAERGIAQAIHHWKSIRIGKLLLVSGADIEAVTTLGESPLAMQVRFGTIDGVRLLLANGADPNRMDRAHMPSGSMVDLIELLLAHGWEIDRGELLHDANHGHGSRVRMWLNYGANPNATRADGKTALHLIASRSSGREAIRALVEAGADLEARDQDGNTPADLARQAKNQAAHDELARLGAP